MYSAFPSSLLSHPKQYDKNQSNIQPQKPIQVGRFIVYQVPLESWPRKFEVVNTMTGERRWLCEFINLNEETQINAYFSNDIEKECVDKGEDEVLLQQLIPKDSEEHIKNNAPKEQSDKEPNKRIYTFHKKVVNNKK